MATLLQYLGREAFETHKGSAAVLSVYRAAEPVEYQDGRAWYATARAELAAMARRYHSTLNIAAAACARMSPQVAWRDNLEATRAVLSAAYHRESEPLVATVYPYNLSAAMDIARARFNGGNVREVIREHLAPLKGKPRPKISAFYDNLARANSAAVTIDAWAIRIWLGDCAAPAMTATPKQIARIAKDYRAAANRIGLRGYELQAVTWVAAHRLARGPNGLLPFDVAAKL